MKSSKSIIKHIINKPQNYKLAELGCYEKIKKALPTHIADAILFIYRKNSTLFFVLNHPGIKMEFDYKHNLIKSLLNKIKTIDKNCQNIQIDEIKSFISNKIEQKSKETLQKRYYKEKSTGEFKVLCEDSELSAIFTKIKEAIKENAKLTK
jgi:hypothetical protein